ncbi:unnamed protein product, partial [Trichobilharzia szidati]
MIRKSAFCHLFKRFASGHACSFSFPDHTIPYTNTLDFIRPERSGCIRIFQVADKNGEIKVPNYKSELDKNLLMDIFTKMITLRTFDKIMYESQRQGRISFYMTSYGEEAATVSSAAALKPEDFIYAQYREAGVLLWRGQKLENLMDQCYSNVGDRNKGRQMPLHYGSRELNFSTVSSPLGTQIPIAAGSAYSYKLAGNGSIVACYFGEGAASEGDAFTGLNFAATLQCPLLLIVRNNAYAISTPSREQYRGDGIVARAIALGIPGTRVDGNDVFAVYSATKMAREICLKECRPVLIEAMTYRVGHHSTSDDSTAYRSDEEVKQWEEGDNPISRLRNYLLKQGWLDEKDEEEMRKKIKEQIMETFVSCEAKNKPNPLLLFTDVYAKMPSRIRQQML